MVKCFAGGCRNQVCFQWQTGNGVTYSCSTHKILNNDTLCEYKQISAPVDFYLTSTCLVFSILIALLSCYIAITSNLATKVSEIDLALSKLSSTIETNYNFYSEIQTIRHIIESLNQPATDDSIASRISFTKDALSVFTETSGFSESAKLKEALLRLYNPNIHLSTKVDLISSHFNIFLEESEGSVLSVHSVGPSHQILIGSHSCAMILFDLDRHTAKILHQAQSSIYSISSNANSETGVLVVGASINAFTMTNFKVLSVFGMHKHWILKSIMSKDDKWVITAGCDKVIKVWDHDFLQYSFNFTGHVDDIWSLALTSDSSILMSGSEDGMLFIWDFSGKVAAKDGKFDSGLKNKQKLTTYPLYSMALFSNNTLLVVGCGDGYILFFNTLTRKVVDKLEHRGLVRSVILIDNDNYLLTVSGRSLRVWNMTDMSVIHECYHTDKLLSVSITSDLKYMVAGDDFNRIWVWDFKTGKLLWVLGGYKGNILKVEVSVDFRRIIVAEDGLVRVWSVETAKELGVLMRREEIEKWEDLDLSGFVRYLK